MIDSHCHLADPAFAEDLPDVVARARAAGLTIALCILAAGDTAEAAQAARLRELWPDVRFATGIHPHAAAAFADGAGELADTVERALRGAGACAIGEIGLDYHYDFAPRDVQQEVFRRQVRLARRLDLPIVIHTREADDDTIRILDEEGGGDVRGIFHCFTGGPELARQALARGFHLSFAGIVTFPRADMLREVARTVPADRLLAETDSPYLAPVPRRGHRNEPAFVVHVMERLAAVRGLPVTDLARSVSEAFDAVTRPR